MKLGVMILASLLCVAPLSAPAQDLPTKSLEAVAPTKPENANVLLNAALKKAKAQKKAVLIVFDASW